MEPIQNNNMNEVIDIIDSNFYPNAEGIGGVLKKISKLQTILSKVSDSIKKRGITLQIELLNICNELNIIQIDPEKTENENLYLLFGGFFEAPKILTLNINQYNSIIKSAEKSDLPESDKKNIIVLCNVMINALIMNREILIDLHKNQNNDTFFNIDDHPKISENRIILFHHENHRLFEDMESTSNTRTYMDNRVERKTLIVNDINLINIRNDKTDLYKVINFFKENPKQLNEVMNNEGDTILHYLCKRKSMVTNSRTVLFIAEIVEGILNNANLKEVNLNIQNKKGDTVFHIATTYPSNDKIMKNLFDKKASVFFKNNKGKTVRFLIKDIAENDRCFGYEEHKLLNKFMIAEEKKFFQLIEKIDINDESQMEDIKNILMRDFNNPVDIMNLFSEHYNIKGLLDEGKVINPAIINAEKVLLRICSEIYYKDLGSKVSEVPESDRTGVEANYREINYKEILDKYLSSKVSPVSKIDLSEFLSNNKSKKKS